MKTHSQNTNTKKYNEDKPQKPLCLKSSTQSMQQRTCPGERRRLLSLHSDLYWGVFVRVLRGRALFVRGECIHTYQWADRGRERH